jgi:hypothetical protein
VRAYKGKKIDWAQIIFNNLCNELDQWYKYAKENKGDKKDTLSIRVGISKNLSIFVCASKGKSIETTSQG